MSTQPISDGRVSLEASLEAAANHNDLIFGDDPQSSVAIPKALMAQFWAQVTEGTGSLSQGALEVGGLLVGPKVRGGRVVVDEIIPLQIEYRFGSLFKMSVFDLPNIAPAIESVQDLSKTVVGFYRSRTCDEKTLRESDKEIFEAVEAAHLSFAADFRCCFIIAPKSESTAVACVAMRNAIGWAEMQPFNLQLNPPAILEFSPSAALQQLTRNLRAEEHASNLPVPVPAPVPPAQPVVERPVAPKAAVVALPVAKPVAENPTVVRRARVWVYAIAGLLAVAVAGAYLLGGRAEPPAFPSAPVQAVTPRFGFSATFESPVWRLSWNRAAMDDLKPVGGILSIQDGDVQQQLPLAPADLASGTIFYTPQSGDLNFGLRVDLGTDFAEEHVRVLGAPGAAQKSNAKSVAPQAPVVQAGVAAPAVVPIAPPPAPNKQLPTATASNSVPVAVPAPTPVAPAPPLIVQSKEVAKAPPPEREIISATPPVLEPTAVAFAIPVPPTFEPPRPVPVPPPATQSATQPAATPSKSEPAAAVPPPSPVSTPPATTTVQAPANYVGPRPIQQVSLQVPSNVPSGVSQVQVMVEIDARGKVTKVNPIAWTAMNAPIMLRAVRAAAGWVFTPAQSNGRPVPSQMILTFRIDTGSQR